MSKIFIVSGKGFYCGFELCSEHNKIHKWSSELTNAVHYASSSKAQKIIDKNNFEAFLWNPFKEQVIPNRYYVHKRVNILDFMTEEKHNILEWVVSKSFYTRTDFRYLGDFENLKYDRETEQSYSLEDAKQVAIEKNTIMLQELTNKINELTNK